MQLNYHREGAGEPLVLIHGIGLTWQSWLPVIDLLAPHRDVIALDLPGFGDSPMPPAGTPAGIASLTRLVSEFLDELGLERPHVAGNSLGGWISFELAKQGRVRSATGLSPAGFHNYPESIYQRGSLWITRRISERIAPNAESLLRTPTRRKLLGSQASRHPERAEPEEMAATVRAFASAPWFDETLRAINRKGFTGGTRISVPVTVAWGQFDRLLLPHQARRAGRMIPLARVVTLRDCGHVPMGDDPEQVARVLLEGSGG